MSVISIDVTCGVGPLGRQDFLIAAVTVSLASFQAASLCEEVGIKNCKNYNIQMLMIIEIGWIN